jgi:hypothetical protein
MYAFFIHLNTCQIFCENWVYYVPHAIQNKSRFKGACCHNWNTGKERLTNFPSGMQESYNRKIETNVARILRVFNWEAKYPKGYRTNKEGPGSGIFWLFPNVMEFEAPPSQNDL